MSFYPSMSTEADQESGEALALVQNLEQGEGITNDECQHNGNDELDDSSTRTNLTTKKVMGMAATFVAVALAATIAASLGMSRQMDMLLNHADERRRLQAACPLSASFTYQNPPVEDVCLYPPKLFEMMYVGGMCPTSLPDEQTIRPSSCEDFNGGPGDRESVYISAVANGVQVYAGTVAKDMDFYLYNREQPLPSPTTLEIYDSMNRETLLQRVTFDSNCEDPNVIGNVFGSSQVIGFVNREQGNVSPGTGNTNTPGMVTAALSSTNGQEVTLKSVKLTTDYSNPNTFTYPPMVGQSPPVEASFQAWLFFPIRYTTTVTVTATDSSGADCSFTATDVYDNTLS